MMYCSGFQTPSESLQGREKGSKLISMITLLLGMEERVTFTHHCASIQDLQEPQ